MCFGAAVAAGWGLIVTDDGDDGSTGAKFGWLR